MLEMQAVTEAKSDCSSPDSGWKPWPLDRQVSYTPLVRMIGVTSLSVVFLLLALCPLDVAGFPADLKVMCLLNIGNTISVMDLATQTEIHQINATGLVTAFGYNRANRKVYWCTNEQRCSVQDYNGSNATVVSGLNTYITDIDSDDYSTVYYIEGQSRQLWIKRDGQPPVMVIDSALSFAVDPANGRCFYVDRVFKIRKCDDQFPIPADSDYGMAINLSWNPSDSLLYFTARKDGGFELRSVDVDTGVQKIIVQTQDGLIYPSAYRDVIVFRGCRGSGECPLNAVYVNGTNLAYLGKKVLSGLRPVLFD